MKQMLTRMVLTLALALMVAAPATLASQTAVAVRRADKASVRMCNQTFRDAKRAAQGLPRRMRRIRMEEARREHKECLRRAHR
ncbi:MAG TPA: hypothetical protein VKA60_07035 [Blastocatellia bacterium]|nr:hypothetical protein [Blastocatellia bacterium]